MFGNTFEFDRVKIYGVKHALHYMSQDELVSNIRRFLQEKKMKPEEFCLPGVLKIRFKRFVMPWNRYRGDTRTCSIAGYILDIRVWMKRLSSREDFVTVLF